MHSRCSLKAYTLECSVPKRGLTQVDEGRSPSFSARFCCMKGISAGKGAAGNLYSSGMTQGLTATRCEASLAPRVYAARQHACTILGAHLPTVQHIEQLNGLHVLSEGLSNPFVIKVRFTGAFVLLGMLFLCCNHALLCSHPRASSDPLTRSMMLLKSSPGIVEIFSPCAKLKPLDRLRGC